MEMPVGPGAMRISGSRLEMRYWKLLGSVKWAVCKAFVR